MKTERVYLVTTGLLLGLLASGCTERNPAYISKKADAALGADAVSDSAADVFVPADTVLGQADGPWGDEIRKGDDAVVDVFTPPSEAGTLLDVGPADARDGGRDTRDARNSESETGIDATADLIVPLDGPRDVPFVAEVGVPDLAPDIIFTPDLVAVDAPPICSEQDTRACSAQGNPMVGACHAGTQTCAGGAWGACLGEVLPAAVELCNGIDDNCNGITDEGCVADCVVVAPDGIDDLADGSAAKPFATIGAAMALASAQDGGAPKRVCVAGGATCGDSHTYPLEAPLFMVSGGRVQGNYALDSSGLSYCADTQPPTTALQFTATEQGVVFDHTVTAPSELSGFVIKRFSQGNGGGAAGPISAVLVKGGVGVTLAGLFVTDAPSADTTYGIDVESGGQTTIVGSAITGGQGRTAAIGINVNGGSVNLRNNCDEITRGVCTTVCSAGGVLGIRGRNGAVLSNGALDSSAVYVTKASPAATSIVANTLCGGPGTPTESVRGVNVAALRCESGACARITGNTLSGGSGRQTVALGLLGGPSLVDGNLVVGGCGTDIATGIVIDDSSARLQNNRIVGAQCGGSTTPDYVGVHVFLGTSGGEPDVHSNVIDPVGAANDCQSFGVVVERPAGDGAAAGILRNNVISAGNCRRRFAVEETANGMARLVENNDLYPGSVSASTDAAILYHRGNTDAVTAAQVNALVGVAKNLSADPKFVSYPNDLHLTSVSPCVDRGTSAGAPSTDGDGNVRPSGGGFDIGAFELPAQ